MAHLIVHAAILSVQYSNLSVLMKYYSTVRPPQVSGCIDTLTVVVGPREVSLK